jgi:hypothetical protein
MGGKEEDGGSLWGGKEEENEGKMACDGHVTRWPFVLTHLTDGRGKMVVFGSWMLYFGRVGSS